MGIHRAMFPSNYDEVAEEYYDDRHVTSRNFDAATAELFDTLAPAVPDSGYVLELGAGRGRTGEFCGVAPSRVVQSDVSGRMLRLVDREPSTGRVQCDATRLPFASERVAAVTAFLFDPYNDPSLFDEIARVLEPGGVFVGTLPHPEWGHTLRRAVDLPQDETVFVTESGEEVRLRSKLLSAADLRDQLTATGLQPRILRSQSLPRDTDDVSEHVEIPAETLGVTPFDLPLVLGVIAGKPAIGADE